MKEIQTNKKLRYFTGNDGNKLPFPLEYYHYQLTTVGALFCTAINSELNANACIINGTPMKASKVYTNRIMSYNELKSEPFQLKMILIIVTIH
ncbi:hypothetical protein HJC23_013932 [Cyclotella cryptica]|uniref:LAGLIDADG homing endonuclease n=1 Tax=Cyclotella cryptica TaxID=29204 RepID=A0ABD3QH53_9STRA